MAVTNNYLGLAVGLDIGELKAGLSEAKSEIQLAESEFRARTGGIEDWANTVQGAGAKVQELQRILEIQQDKLARYTQLYRESAEKFGEDSPETKKWLTAMNNQTGRVRDLEKELDGWKTKLGQLALEEDEAGGSVDGLRKKVELLQAEYDDAVAKVEKYASELNAAQTEESQSQTEISETTRKLEAAQEELRQTSDKLDVYKTALDTAETQTRELKGETDKLNDELAETDRTAASSAKEGGGWSVMKGAISDLASNILQSAINKVKEFAQETFKLGADYSKAMSEVRAISGATEEDMKKLESVAREMGRSTTFSAVEAADGLKYMALAGWNANESADALAGVLALAESAGMDLGKASDIVTDYLSAFGLTAKDAGEFADRLAYTQSHANTTAEQLADAYKNSAATLKASGQNVDTVTALLAKMADQGLKGGEAGTALRNVMTDLTKEMEGGAVQIGETTVAVADQDGNFRNLTDVIADVEAATADMTETERASALQNTFTKDAMKALNLIMAAGTENVKDFEGQLANSAGTAKEMSDVMNDNLSGDMAKLHSAIDDLKLTIMDLLGPTLRGGIQWVTDNLPLVIALIGGIAGALGTIKLLTTIPKIIEGLTAVSTVMTALKAGTIATTAATVAQTAAQAAQTVAANAGAAAQWLLNAAMDANPIGLIVIAITGLIAAFKLLWDNSEEFRQFWIGLWESIKGVAEGAWNAITGFFRAAWETIQKVIGGLKAWLEKLFTDPLGAIKDAWNGIGDFFGKIWETVKNTALSLPAYFLNLGGEILGKLVDGIKGAISGVVNAITDVARNIYNGFLSFFGIHSPSTLMSDAGYNVTAGIADGMGRGYSLVEGQCSRISQLINDTALSATERVKKLSELSAEELATASVEDLSKLAKEAYSNTKSVVKTTLALQELEAAYNEAKATQNVATASSSSSNVSATKIANMASRAAAATSASQAAEIKALTEKLQDELQILARAIGDDAKLSESKKDLISVLNGLRSSGDLGQIAGQLKTAATQAGNLASQAAYRDNLAAYKEVKAALDRVSVLAGEAASGGKVTAETVSMMTSAVDKAVDAAQMAAAQAAAAVKASGTSAAAASGNSDMAAAAERGATVSYTQIINSPTQIDAATVYRQTKSIVGASWTYGDPHGW